MSPNILSKGAETRWGLQVHPNLRADVATDPLSLTRAGDVFVQGAREGVEIEVLIRRGEIWTGYPLNILRNP